MDWWIVVLVVAELAFAGFIIWLVVRTREARMRQRAEERTRLLERFASAQELNEFLNSEAGTRLLGALKGEPAHPARKLAATATGGIISLFVGLAFLIPAARASQDSQGGLLIPGALFVMAGIGILVSAAVSAWLYRRAGLLPSSKP